MNKKLSELMNDIQQDLIEEMIIEEELEEKPQVSIERIKVLATRNIVEQSQLQLYKGARDNEKHIKREKRGKSLIRKIVIPLVAATTLIVGVVAAVNYNPTLKSIFGEYFPFKDQVQPIEKSMSAYGLTFTAEGAFIDKKSGLFVVSFIKSDGTTFEEGTEVRQVQVKTQKPGAMGWGIQNQLSKDRKQLNCLVDVSADQKLYGQKLTLEANDIRIWRNLAKVSTVSLEELSRTEINQPWENYSSNSGLQQMLVEDFKEINLDAFTVSDKGFELITSYYDKANIEDQTTYVELFDERTQQSYKPSASDHYWSEKEALNKDYYVFDQFKEEDLPYLKIKVGNNYFEKVLEGNWQVDFKLEKNSQTKTKKVSKTIVTEDQKVTIKKIEVSALGVTLEGYKGSKHIKALQNVYLEMKDGTEINFDNTGSNSDGIKFNMYYTISSNENAHIKENSKDKEGLTEGVSTSTVNTTSELLLSDFINISQVKSIVIEGVEIPLE